jgi:hypothetical protein
MIDSIATHNEVFYYSAYKVVLHLPYEVHQNALDRLHVSLCSAVLQRHLMQQRQPLCICVKKTIQQHCDHHDSTVNSAQLTVVLVLP